MTWNEYKKLSASDISRIYAQHLPMSELGEECLDCIFKSDKATFNIYFNVFLEQQKTSRTNSAQWRRYAQEHGMDNLPELDECIWRRKDIVDFYSDSLHKRTLKEKKLTETDILVMIDYLLDFPQAVKTDLLYRTILNASFHSEVLEDNYPVFTHLFEQGLRPVEREYDNFILTVQLETRPAQLHHLKREFPYYQTLFTKLETKTRLEENLPEHHHSAKKIKL